MSRFRAGVPHRRPVNRRPVEHGTKPREVGRPMQGQNGGFPTVGYGSNPERRKKR